MKTQGRDFLVYLAGPITGLTYADGQSWRNYVSQNLPTEIRAMSPLRSQEAILGSLGVLDETSYENPLCSDRGLTTRDRMDCTRADAILVNLLGTSRVSIGTCMEFGWADMNRIPIVLVIEKSGNIHDHAMIRDVTGFRTDSLDEALIILEHILLPEGTGTPREGV
jgi:nucleoside 2-deoxyribosyltransferase